MYTLPHTAPLSLVSVQDEKVNKTDRMEDNAVYTCELDLVLFPPPY